MENTSKAYFDDVATQWDTMREGFFPESVREDAIQTAQVRAGAVAVDLGAGSGFVTEALLAADARVIAVDQSEAMLDVLQQKFGDQVDARLGSSQALPLADALVEYAFANMYLHHVEEPAAAIHEAARVIRSGGRLVITDLDAHNYDFLREEHHDRWMGFERSDIQQWFEQAGFTDVVVRDVGSSCTCDATSCCGSEEASVTIFLAIGTKA